MTLIVREATPRDEADVTLLWRDCGLVASYNDPRSDFRFACAGPASTVLVGLDEERVIGTVMVGHDGHRGWLYYVACMAERRRTGVGRSMIASAEDWLRAHGVVKVHLMVREANAEVTGFYKRLGFESMPRIALSKWLNQ